jgi:8-oxo-dGTP diphosphatase
MTYRQPALAVDAVVFDGAGRLLLIRRRNAPFKGRYALPGGFVEYGETVEAAARRELMEETGVRPLSQRLIGVYSKPGRDPRGHTVSVAYLMRVGDVTPQAGDDAHDAAFVARWRGKRLAFDHSKILADALKLKRKP